MGTGLQIRAYESIAHYSSTIEAGKKLHSGAEGMKFKNFPSIQYISSNEMGSEDVKYSNAARMNKHFRTMEQLRLAPIDNEIGYFVDPSVRGINYS